MSLSTTKSDLFEDLSPEKQELVAGGQFIIQMDEFEDPFGEDDFDRPRRRRAERDFDRRDDRDFERDRVRKIPIRLTGVLEIMK